ncbi:MAG: hypothetical protein JWO86_5834 [Myxococcaceae bacterium]|nr:hypothetical protein [Myxococcaceae bacterium]
MTCTFARVAGAQSEPPPAPPPPAAAPPPPWTNAEAYELSLAAETARAAGLWDTCIEKDTASLAKEEQIRTRVHLAGCADRAGKVLVALQQMQFVLEKALAVNDPDVAGLAQARAAQLMRRLGSLTIEPSAEAKELVVTVDDVVVPPDSYKKRITVDPGKHRIHAEGLLEGAQASFDDVEDIADGDRAMVVIALRPRAADFLTPGQLACMQLAKTQLEVLQCLPGANKPLVIRAALEMSGYADTFSTMVLNPAVRASVTSPTHGWNIGASYLVDVISTASPDFISTASPRGKDLRQAVAVNGGYKPGRFGFDAAAGFSTEADYVSRSGGLGLIGDFMEKRVTPRIGWSYSNDTIGRGGTPTSVFSHTLISNEVAGSVSIVMSPTTVAVIGLTAGFERGDQSKPYRLIPMFADDVTVPKGASPDEVNAKRLPVRPYEQLPLERDKYALGFRLVHRFGGSTLRLEERLYDDTWQNRASTTDGRFLIDLGSHLTFGPHARYHVQTGTNFYHRVYHAELEPLVTLPVLRTTDRELGPMWSVTGGGSLWWRLTDEHASHGWTIYFSGDALWSHYTNALYVTERLAGYSTIGLETELE